jgi:putative transposase
LIVSRLTVHLVCGTKYRRKVFDDRAPEFLTNHASQAFANMDCQLLACDGEADHAPMLVEHPPKLSVSVLVNMFKGTSSRMLRQARPPDIAERYWGNSGLWSPSYCAASTGARRLRW